MLLSFQFFSEIVRSYYIVIACTLVFWSISIHTNFNERDQFSSKNTAAGLPKKTICCETEALLKHLRYLYHSFWRGASNCAVQKNRVYVVYFLRITLQKRKYELLHTTNGCASSRAFHPYIQICHGPFGLTANYFFVCPHRMSNPAVGLYLGINTKDRNKRHRWKSSVNFIDLHCMPSTIPPRHKDVIADSWKSEEMPEYLNLYKNMFRIKVNHEVTLTMADIFL